MRLPGADADRRGPARCRWPSRSAPGCWGRRRGPAPTLGLTCDAHGGAAVRRRARRERRAAGHGRRLGAPHREGPRLAGRAGRGFDAAVSAALASGDPELLGRLDPELGSRAARRRGPGLASRGPAAGRHAAGTARGQLRRRAVRGRLPRRHLVSSPSGTDPMAPVIAVVGPTAAGKSDLGVALAQRARRRGHQRRLDAALRGHGHRHRQADAGRAAGRPAPSARHLASPAPGRRRHLPAAGPRARSTRCLPPAARRSWSAAAGCTCGPRSTRWSFPGPIRQLRAELEADLAQLGPGGAARPARRHRPGGGGGDPARQRPPAGAGRWRWWR